MLYSFIFKGILEQIEGCLQYVTTCLEMMKKSVSVEIKCMSEITEYDLSGVFTVIWNGCFMSVLTAEMPVVMVRDFTHKQLSQL